LILRCLSALCAIGIFVQELHRRQPFDELWKHDGNSQEVEISVAAAGNGVPEFTTDDDLRSGGLFCKAKAKPMEGRLIVGVFDTDDCWVLQWRGKS
jgi:hypothetical protein